MKLQDQVCSLELAKRLKELGVKQDSLFYWRTFWNRYKEVEPEIKDTNTVFSVGDEGWYITRSAYTVAELGEMLPADYRGYESFNGEMTEYDTEGMAFKTYKIKDKWICEAFEEDIDIEETEADTEADARAKMLIYLLDNKLITL